MVWEKLRQSVKRVCNPTIWWSGVYNYSEDGDGEKVSEIRDTEVIMENITLSQDTYDIGGLLFKFQEVC